MKKYVFLLVACSLITCKNSTKSNIEIIHNMDETITFKTGDASLKIDPADGAKDISLNVFGVELLTGKELRKEYYGSSLWLSPQTEFWPQSVVLDFGPYTASEVQDGMLFTSRNDQEHGFQYFKEITVDQENMAFIHHYRIRNISDSLQSCAAWEVSRLPKKGISVFPVSEYGVNEERPIDPSIPTLLEEGLMWHSYDPSQLGHPGKHCKTFAFGAEGWLGYVLGDVLLIKQFQNYSPDQVAVGESDVEIYVCDEYDYIELESQGAYTSLAPGEELEYTVTWSVAKLPQGIDKNPGSKDLVSYIRGLINR